jgi:hypothetical protein
MNSTPFLTPKPAKDTATHIAVKRAHQQTDELGQAGDAGAAELPAAAAAGGRAATSDTHGAATPAAGGYGSVDGGWMLEAVFDARGDPDVLAAVLRARAAERTAEIARGAATPLPGMLAFDVWYADLRARAAARAAARVHGEMPEWTVFDQWYEEGGGPGGGGVTLLEAVRAGAPQRAAELAAERRARRAAEARGGDSGGGQAGVPHTPVLCAIQLPLVVAVADAAARAGGVGRGGLGGQAGVRRSRGPNERLAKLWKEFRRASANGARRAHRAAR